MADTNPTPDNVYVGVVVMLSINVSVGGCTVTFKNSNGESLQAIALDFECKTCWRRQCRKPGL